MTLAITTTPGLGQEAESATHNYWDTIDGVELQLVLMGFEPMEKPEFRSPQIDAQLYQALSQGDGKLLTYFHMQFSAWYAYAHSRIGQVSGRIRQIENEMQDVRRSLRRTIVNAATTAAEKKPSAETIEDQAQLDPRYRELTLELQKYQQALDQLEAHKAKLSAGKQLTSRAVEVRRQDLESNLEGGRGYSRRPQ